MLAGTHGYQNSYEAYQAPVIEAAGALGGIQSGGSWRMLLLGGAAAGALSFGVSRGAHAAPDACSAQAGGARTCTGNQSAGISYNAEAGLTTLNVNTLTQNIAPAAGTDGIYFNAVGAATLNSTTTPFSITATGSGSGIYARTTGANPIDVSHTGDITARHRGVMAISSVGDITIGTSGTITSTDANTVNSRAIFADSINGSVSVTHTGDMTSAGATVFARSNGGNVTVLTTGNITSTSYNGVFAQNSSIFTPGAVSVTHTGDMTTRSGIFADSKAGAVTVTFTGDLTSTDSGIAASGKTSATVTHTGNITAGQAGVSANSAGNVTVNTTGNITSTGGVVVSSRGIFADAINGSVNVTHTGDISAAGASVFARSNTGNVTVTTTGNITSTAYYLFFQTSSTLNPGAVSVTHTGNITTLNGLLAESKGGGGVSVNITGNLIATDAASSGIRAVDAKTGAVTVTHTGNITAGLDGVSAQSAGGGVTVDTTGDITATAGRGIYAGGGAAAVNVTHTGDITANSSGVQAVSVGGGMTVNTTGNITSTTQRGIYVQDTAAGAVMVTHTGGNIQAQTEGVHTRSAGGGVTVNTTGNITSTGNRGIYARDNGAGAVTVTHTGDITGGLDGVYAVSTGGGVTVNTTGNITSTGATGIQAQDTAGNIGITTGGGTVTGPTAGVSFVVGATNTLTNLAGGTITSAGNAVLGTTGDETVNNSGIVTGNVDLGAGTNAFNNLAGGTFNSGATVTLTGANLLTNSGNLSPLGTGTVGTTALTGNLVQNAGGTTTIDVNVGANTNDLVTVTGTANLAGTVAVNVVNVAATTNRTITVETSAGGNTDNGLGLSLPAALQGALVVNAANVQITFTVNFLGPGGGATLTPNQQATATGLNTILTTGAGGAQGLLTALANLPTSAFGDALDQLSPEALGNFSFGTLLASLGFTDNAFSCKADAGMYAFIREAECVWLRPGGRRFIQDRTDDNLGFTESAFGVSGGVQTALDRDKTWFAGVTAGYENVDFESDAGRTIVTGSRFQGGAVVKHLRGSLLLAAGVTGGYGTFESARTIRFAGFNGVAEGDFNTPFVTGRLRAAYLFEGPAGQQADWYVKPAVDLDFTWLKRGGFTESGATGANLQISSESQFTVSVSPSIEIGGEFEIGTSRARPFLKLGAQIFSNTSNDTTARFAAAPGSPNFTVTSKTDRVFGTVSTGIDVVHEKALSLKLQYDGKFSGNSRQHAIGAKFSWRF